MLFFGGPGAKGKRNKITELRPREKETEATTGGEGARSGQDKWRPGATGQPLPPPVDATGCRHFGTAHDFRRTGAGLALGGLRLFDPLVSPPHHRRRGISHSQRKVHPPVLPPGPGPRPAVRQDGCAQAGGDLPDFPARRVRRLRRPGSFLWGRSLFGGPLGDPVSFHRFRGGLRRHHRNQLPRASPHRRGMRQARRGHVDCLHGEQRNDRPLRSKHSVWRKSAGPWLCQNRSGTQDDPGGTAYGSADHQRPRRIPGSGIVGRHQHV